MLSHEQNMRLTQVGPGTPAGELLRRYWMAVCPADEITADNPKKRIRILGEDLLVYRSPSGEIICIEEHCAHRKASLYFGFIEDDGIRCCYHGWKFDVKGACIERPFETSLGTGISVRAYPVQELGGLLFVYMGPHADNPPLLPRWDVMAREDGKRDIVVLPTHGCNWLQIQENTVDTVHTYYLHGHLSMVHQIDQVLAIGKYFYRPIVDYDWGVCDWGISKSVEYGGDNPETEVRPPLIFPNILRIPEGPVEALHFRVPVDDTHTRVIWVGLREYTGEQRGKNQAEVSFRYEPDEPFDINKPDFSTFYGQDRAVWETQGAIYDRSQETLGASDRGIVMFRRMLAEQIDLVEQGKEPTVAVVRAAKDKQMIVFEEATKPTYDVTQTPSAQTT